MAKLKSENKNQLLVAFLAKQTPQTKKSCMSSYRIKVYPVTGKSCWVLVYSVLLVALFSGTNFKDFIASLTWPCTLPLSSGMALQLVLTTLPLSDVFRIAFIETSLLFVRCFYCFRWNNETWIIWVVELCSTLLLWTWFVVNFSSTAITLRCMKCSVL